MLYNILCIYDDPTMLESLKDEWEKYGGCLTSVHDTQEAIRVLRDRDYHLIGLAADYLQERLLPSIKAMRDATDMPIVVVTTQYDNVQMVASLRSGADNYLMVPKTAEEIVMIGFAQIRRYCAFDCDRHEKKEVNLQGIHLDLRDRKAVVGGNEVYLTRGEFECLWMLMSHPGRAFSCDVLYYGSFGEEAQADYVISSIRALIGRIRHKFGPEYGRVIKTVHRVGYKVDGSG